jgi:cytochrome c5
MKLATKSLSATAAALVACLFAGCQSSTHATMLSDGSAKPAAAPTAAPATKGRAQIWAETCNRCHNTRSPDSYSGKEWSVVMTHMRVRGYLTGEDQRAILEFLQQQ